MPGPLIPYIEAPEIPLAFLKYIPILGDQINAAHPPSIKPFGTLVALGVYVGAMVTMARARERKLDVKPLSDFIFWVVASGFVISHMLDAIFYHPDTVMENPLYLLKIWDGLSSYGGLIGAVIGTFAWGFYRKKRVLEYVDLCVSAFPLAWVFGRSGCSVVHDHPGALSNAWYAVQYPARTLQAGYSGRLDLGLIEMVLTIPLAVACWWLWRKRPLRPAGFYVGLTLIYYAPIRFVLDFLRVTPEDTIFRGATDPRYAGLTPAQWACFLAIAVGLLFAKRAWGQPYVRLAPLAPPEDDEDPAHGEDEDERPDEEGQDQPSAKPEADEPEPDQPEAAEVTSPEPKRAKKKRKRKRQAKG